MALVTLGFSTQLTQLSYVLEVPGKSYRFDITLFKRIKLRSSSIDCDDNELHFQWKLLLPVTLMNLKSEHPCPYLP